MSRVRNTIAFGFLKAISSIEVLCAVKDVDGLVVAERLYALPIVTTKPTIYK